MESLNDGNNLEYLKEAYINWLSLPHPLFFFFLPPFLPFFGLLSSSCNLNASNISFCSKLSIRSGTSTSVTWLQIFRMSVSLSSPRQNEGFIRFDLIRKIGNSYRCQMGWQVAQVILRLLTLLADIVTPEVVLC